VRTVFDLLRATYQECPDRVALILQETDVDLLITYRELLDRAVAYATLYTEAGIQPGEPIVLLLQHGRPLIESFFGAILHGAIPSIMPFLTEKLSPERYRVSLTSLIQITKPVAIVTYPEFFNEVHQARTKGDSVRKVLVHDDVGEPAEWTWEQLHGVSSEPVDIVLLQHSSGTTGLQKGVALSHQAVLNQVDAYARAIDMNEEDVVVSWLPLYHDMGLIAGFILPILLRATLVLMSPFDWVRAPYRLMKSVTKYSGTLTWLPNFAYNFCTKKIRDRDLEGVDLSSLRAVINCSEPMRWQSHDMFLTRFKEHGLKEEALATCYAMAENVFAVTQGGIDSPVRVDEVDREELQSMHVAKPASGDESSIKMLSAGRPIEHTRVRVIDLIGNDLPERHIGEIALQGNCLLTGYFNRDDLTEKAFIDGWYRTGDLGYLAGGELFITGREKELIIVGGKNIHPQDLEEIVNDMDGVYPGRVVAFGVFNEELGTEDIVIVAETTLQGNDEKTALARKIRDTISQSSDVTARYVEIVEREWLIKTSSGKIARGANREKYLEIAQG
jgi:fatty-acyl-CoA synthase